MFEPNKFGGVGKKNGEVGWGENYNPDAMMSPNGRNAVEVHCFHSYHSLALAGRCEGDGRRAMVETAALWPAGWRKSSG